VCANLKTIGGPGAAGTIIFSKNLFYNHKGNHEYFIVNQSITGLFEQKVNLKTL